MFFYFESKVFSKIFGWVEKIELLIIRWVKAGF